ncbi:MAG: type IV pilus assembly protein PilM, partial [Phycisphaerae bacterium]
MAPHGGTVWAIEIGNSSLKALRLGDLGQGVQVLGFSNIEYGKILAGSGVSADERDELIALGLRKFLRENNVGKEDVIVSVPSQTSFARFVNLPPVEEKKIPQVVRLEAGMQIPFDMSEVQWDWQLMSRAEEGQVRIGIFAIKNEVVTKELEYFGNEGLPVGAVQMVPMALYNYVVYDRPELVKSDKEATCVINIGTETTDLVVCSKNTVWQRCIPMGGNSFTRAIADAFKLNFEKAEKLKRTAAMSKYARQVFQAMRPVFSDFVSEVQRSLGFFSQSQADCRVTSVIALGGGTKLRGLLKYLGQTLQIPIEKPDVFKKLVVSEGVSAAEFGQRIGEFAVVYGLALQGLGLGKIESNLLPKAVASSMAMAVKAKYITVAAAVLMLVVLLGIGRTVYDNATYEAQSGRRSTINNIVRDAEQAKQKLLEQKRREETSKTTIEQACKPLEYREVIPQVIETVLSVFPNSQNNSGQSELYQAFETGDVDKLLQTPRKKREQIFVTSMSVYYTPDVEGSRFGQTRMKQSSSQAVSKSQTESTGAVGSYMQMMREAQESLNQENAASQSQESKGGTVATEEKGGEGFVVVLSGYTPYENIEQMLDPAGVDNDRERWGVITRLMNLNKLSDANSPFSLYKKTQIQHFELKTGPVKMDS